MIKIKPKALISLLLVFLLSLSSFVYADNNDALTVQDAVKIAMANSIDVMKYTNAVKQNERDLNETIISTRQLDEVLKIDDHYRKLARKPNRTEAEEAEYQMLKEMLGGYMSFSQRLNMQISSELGPSNMEYILNIDKNLLQSAKDNVYISVYSSFNNLTKTEDSIQIKNALISNLETSYRAASLKHEQGLLSNSSLSLMELDLEKARIELEKLSIQRQKDIIQINILLGAAMGTEFNKYANDTVPQDITIKELNDYINTAFANREDIKTAKQYYEIKQKEFEITKEYYYYDTSVTNKNAQIALNTAKSKLDSTEVNVQLQVMNAYNSFNSQLTNLEKSKVSRDLNASALQQAKDKYKMGLATELELNKANINYSQSQLAYLSASRDTWLAKLSLDIACGIVVNNN